MDASYSPNQIFSIALSSTGYAFFSMDHPAAYQRVHLHLSCISNSYNWSQLYIANLDFSIGHKSFILIRMWNITVAAVSLWRKLNFASSVFTLRENIQASISHLYREHTLNLQGVSCEDGQN